MALLGPSKADLAKRYRVQQAAMGNTEVPMAPPMEPVAPQTMRAHPLRGVVGAFGRGAEAVGRVLNTNTDNPGTLQTLLFGTDWADSRFDRKRQAEEDAYTRSERQRAEQQRAQLEAYIATLPPEQQAYARLNPEAFVKAMMTSQGGGELEYHDFGAFNPRTGQWAPIQGAADLYRRAHPQAPNATGMPPLPPGFQIETDQ